MTNRNRPASNISTDRASRKDRASARDTARDSDRTVTSRPSFLQSQREYIVRRQGWLSRLQLPILVAVIVFFFIFFAGLYLSQVVSYAATVRDVEALIDTRDQLERGNEQMRSNIANERVVPSLLARAESLGFRPAAAADILYIVVDGYNPNRELNIVDLELADETRQQAQYTETFGGWVSGQLDDLRRQVDTPLSP